jgi:hypothetical protein
MILKTYTDQCGNNVTLTVEFDKYYFPKAYVLRSNADVVRLSGKRANAKVIFNIFDRIVKDFEREDYKSCKNCAYHGNCYQEQGYAQILSTCTDYKKV